MSITKKPISAPKTDLTVIICSLGRSQSLDRCLSSLALQSYKNFEVIIVSDNDGFSRLKIYPLLIKTIQDPRLGLAKARDLGWQNASSDLVSWIDDDVVTDKDWAKEVVSTFKDISIGGVSGPTLIPPKLLKNRLVFWWYGQKTLLAKLWIKFMLDGNPYQVGKLTKNGWWTPGSNFSKCLKLSGLQPVDYLEACNMSLRRSLVKRVGGFDLNYKGTGEWCEVDLALRVNKLGYRLVFNPKVIVYHHVSQQGVFSKRFNYSERIANYLMFRWTKWKLA